MAAEADAAPSPEHAAATWRWPVLGFALAAVVIVADQISKLVVLDRFGPATFAELCRHPGERRAVCPGVELSSVFDLSMVWNRGVSFGLLQADSDFGRWALVAFTTGVAVLLAVWLARARRPFVAVALGFVVGGAIGNTIDRARFGAVVDFLDFSGLYFPWVFNVADAAINVGAAFLVLEILLDRRAKR
jgi:signal peptidase II